MSPLYFYKNILLSIYISCLPILFFTVIAFSQTGEGQFRISDVEKSENAQSVLITVVGEFVERDVVNIYINDEFINSEAVNTEEEINGIVVVSNVPLSKFLIGTNIVRGRLQRGGSEIYVTPDRSVVIEDKVETPSVFLEKIENTESTYRVQVTADITFGDTIAFFSNGEEVLTLFASKENEESGQFVLERVDGDELLFGPGDNYIQVEIRRGSLKSELSERSESFFIEELEPIVNPEIEDETMAEEEVEEEIVTNVIPACFNIEKRTSFSKGDPIVGFGENISLKGSVLAISSEHREVFLYEKIDGVWTDAVTLSDFGGQGIATNHKLQVEVISDTEVLVGVPFSDKLGHNAGLIYRYIKLNGLWQNVGFINAPIPSREDFFASNITSDGDILVVSSVGEDLLGKVYVYRNINGNWIIDGLITPSIRTEKQNFGSDISISDGVIAVGDSGFTAVANKINRIFLYTLEDGTWKESIIIGDHKGGNGYGLSVFLYEDYLFVSDLFGSVSVFKKLNDAWVSYQKLDDGLVTNRTEISFTALGDVLVIGSSKSTNLKTNAGAVFVYKKNPAGLWVLDKTLDKNVVTRNDKYGKSLSFDGPTIFIGAPNFKENGEVYTYEFVETSCELEVEEEVETEKEIKEKNQKNRESLIKAIEDAVLLISLLHSKLQNIIPEVEDVKTYIVVSPDKVSADAQRKAAEQRGILAPGLPISVNVELANENDTIPEDEKERTRDEIINNTKDSTGMVIPVEEKTLTFGDVDDEILRLQIFLNNNGFPVATDGPGSPKNETRYFDENTREALTLFQSINGINSTGELDSATRKLILLYIR